MKNYENIIAFMNNYAEALVESAKANNESGILLSYEFGMKDALNNVFGVDTINLSEEQGLIDDAMLYIGNNLEAKGLFVDFDDVSDLNLSIRL